MPIPYIWIYIYECTNVRFYSYFVFTRFGLYGSSINLVEPIGSHGLNHVCVCTFHQREQTRANGRLIIISVTESKREKKFKRKQKQKRRVRIKHIQKYKREYKYSSLDRLFGSIKVHAHRQINNKTICSIWIERENTELFCCCCCKNLMIRNPNWVAALNERESTERRQNEQNE